MPRQGPRSHRLPQRLDYTLIPAPLDLTLPVTSEKSHLPAIIVTPSSPSSSHDFSIAFLAPEPKPTIRERLSKLPTPSPLRARTILLFLFIFFILLCHVVTHRLAARRQYLDFTIQEESHASVGDDWFNFSDLWSTGGLLDDKRNFVVTESEG